MNDDELPHAAQIRAKVFVSRNNEYAGDRKAPISSNTILTLNTTGHVINAWGAMMFFMPHMITVDKQNNVWVTDVAMHQVFKFPPYGGTDKKPKIVLGQPVSISSIKSLTTLKPIEDQEGPRPSNASR